MIGVLRGNCCETCRNVPKNTPMKKFTKENFLTRQNAFSEHLQQLLLLINKIIFHEVAVGSRFVLFEVIILIYL